MFHALSMSVLVSVSFWTLCADALFHALLFATLGVMLWIVLQYGKYETLMQAQRIISYGALGITVVVVGVGTGYFLDYIFLDEADVIALISTLPVKGLLGLMIYALFVLYFYVNLQHLEVEQEQSPSRPEKSLKTEPEPEPESIQYEPVQDESAYVEMLERIMVKTKQTIKIIPISDIVYLRSEGDYVMIISNDGKYLKEQTMKYFELHLPKSLFVRVHRSYIVNIEYISAIESYGKQNQQVLLKNGEWLKVSLAGYKALKLTLR
jgi:DNA-binding LytR/AlgR family response regulator